MPKISWCLSSLPFLRRPMFDRLLLPILYSYWIKREFFFFQFWQLNLGHHIHQMEVLCSWGTFPRTGTYVPCVSRWLSSINVYVFMGLGGEGRGRQPQLLLLRSYSPCFLQQGFSLALKLPCSLVWLISVLLGIHLSLSPQPSDYKQGCVLLF